MRHETHPSLGPEPLILSYTAINVYTTVVSVLAFGTTCDQESQPHRHVQVVELETVKRVIHIDMYKWLSWRRSRESTTWTCTSG